METGSGMDILTFLSDPLLHLLPIFFEIVWETELVALELSWVTFGPFGILSLFVSFWCVWIVTFASASFISGYNPGYLAIPPLLGVEGWLEWYFFKFFCFLSSSVWSMVVVIILALSAGFRMQEFFILLSRYSLQTFMRLIPYIFSYWSERAALWLLIPRNCLIFSILYFFFS